jgi:hypothetical protein
MNAIILKGAALCQPPLPQSGPRAKTIAHPWARPYMLMNCDLQKDRKVWGMSCYRRYPLSTPNISPVFRRLKMKTTFM